MAGVIERQGKEPLCSQCISFALTVEETVKMLDAFDASVDKESIPVEFAPTLNEASAIIRAAKVPHDPQRQRKIGACSLPDKACFVKKVKMFFLAVEEENS